MSRKQTLPKPTPPDPELVITFDKASKFYEPGEKVSGTVNFFKINGNQQHQEVSATAEAFMDTVSAIRGNQGRPPLKPEERTMMMSKKLPLSNGGTVGPNDPIRFDFILESTTQNPLIDAYIGVEFSIIYKVSVNIKTPSDGPHMGKIKAGSAEFYCAVPGSGIDPKQGRSYVPQDYSIKPESVVQNVKDNPKFEFSGKIASVNCCFSECFDGFLMCKDSDLQIKSIEIQLVRVETFEGKTVPTEVQNIQIADGNVIPDLEIPMYMLFPKIYSCATIHHAKFRIEFEINLIVIFLNGFQLTENFPIRIYR